MKNCKYVVFGIMLSFIIFFLLTIFLSNVNRNSKILIKDYEQFDETIDSITKKVQKIKKEECRVAINSMIDRIKSNHLSGEVSIKEYTDSFFADDLTFVDYYNYVSSSCSINNEQLYVNAMGTLVYPTYIKNKYNKSYEFYIKDNYYYDKDFDKMGTYSTLVNEVSILSDILEELS